MKKLTVVWMILIILLVFSLTFLGVNISKRKKPYKDFESDIVEALKIYCGQDVNLKKLPKNNEILKITLDELKDFGLEVRFQNSKDKCDGYGLVKKKGLSYSYEGYIKCKNYTTDNYE